ncbi:MAG TPA: hypothetical protein VLF20_00310 [Patescibacteria group bacterium]|nr:hypothetical protein [Patescibacteria group bacterium]
MAERLQASPDIRVGVVPRKRGEALQFLGSKWVRPASETRSGEIRSNIARLIEDGFFDRDAFIQNMTEYVGGRKSYFWSKTISDTFLKDPPRHTFTSDPLPIPGFGGTVTFVSQKHEPGSSYHNEVVFRVPRGDHDDLLVISSGYSSGWIDSSKPKAGVFDEGPYSRIERYTTPPGGDFFQKRELNGSARIEDREWLVAVANAAFGIKRRRVGNRVVDYTQTGETMRRTMDAFARGEEVMKGTSAESGYMTPGTEAGIISELSRLVQGKRESERVQWPFRAPILTDLNSHFAREKSEGIQVLSGVGDTGTVHIVIPTRKGEKADFTRDPIRIDFMGKDRPSHVESSYFIQQDPYTFRFDMKRRVIDDPTDLRYDTTKSLPPTERVEDAETRQVLAMLKTTQTVAPSRN